MTAVSPEPAWQPLRILLLAHDLQDSTIRKRAAMLVRGGAVVTIAGFQRGETPPPAAGEIILGQTYDGLFLHRALTILKAACGLRRRKLPNSDIVIARNLEMLALGVYGLRRYHSNKPVLVYECLDIHRLLLRRDPIGWGLRWLEGRLARRAALLLTSSDAFVKSYFVPLSQVKLPIRLIENKPLLPTDAAIPAVRPIGPPWIIGWFGIIRCRQSLALLKALVEHSRGMVKVIIRGRPALDQFDDFHGLIAATPGIEFLGPYRSPDDLAALYGSVHFNWAIDLFEAGLNSSWLLPNRLYEGGLFGAVPIVEANVASGRYLEQLKLGVRLQAPLHQQLLAFFTNLTPAVYARLAAEMAQVPRSQWLCTEADCVELVRALGDLRLTTTGAA